MTNPVRTGNFNCVKNMRTCFASGTFAFGSKTPVKHLHRVGLLYFHLLTTYIPCFVWIIEFYTGVVAT